MEILVIWITLSVIAGIAASNKGRSGTGFFLLALLLSPLIGLLAALAVAPGEKPEPIGSPGVLFRPRLARCPFCAEEISREAVVCKHCGRDLPVKEQTA